ncbi:hypothetical protein WJX84_010729 [Apatococcus fuscideae]|uniref:Uncharacterized protein n=1 Tax=Apatococcus fuscideae TaxID=2026836 RepID=A0AAW1TJG8_9CHLO
MQDPGASKAKNRLRVFLDLCNEPGTTGPTQSITPRINPERLAAKEQQLADIAQELLQVRLTAEKQREEAAQHLQGAQESLASETARRRKAANGEVAALARVTEVQQQVDAERTASQQRMAKLRDQMHRKDKSQKEERDKLVRENLRLQQQADQSKSCSDITLTPSELTAIAHRILQNSESRGGAGVEQARHWGKGPSMLAKLLRRRLLILKLSFSGS